MRNSTSSHDLWSFILSIFAILVTFFTTVYIAPLGVGIPMWVFFVVTSVYAVKRPLSPYRSISFS